MRNTSTIDKLVAEIDQAQGEGKLGDPTSYKEFTAHLSLPTSRDKRSKAHPPQHLLLFERHVPPGGVEICNRHIPAGRIVGVNAWVVHRGPFRIPEPEKFLPERRIESGAERLKELEASFFAVGTGSKDVYWEKLQLGGNGYDCAAIVEDSQCIFGRSGEGVGGAQQMVSHLA